MTTAELVRTINAREQYTYFVSPSQKFRVISARTRRTRCDDREFQVLCLHDGKWLTCCPSEISVERY